MTEPKYEVGSMVQFGYGVIRWEVLAIITTGRNPTYDLICREGQNRGHRRQAVPETYLKHHYPRRRTYA